MQTLLLALLSVSSFLWLRRIWIALRSLRLVPRLKPAHEATSADIHQQKLMVVIPARNEESNLPHCLDSICPSLRAWDTCLVINDRSTDGTENCLKARGFSPARDGLQQKIYLTLTESPKPGWTGKNNALAAALPYLENADWILFTDADTVHEKNGITSALAYANTHQVDLLTLVPHCLTASWIEHLIQPTAMGLMGLWYPLEASRFSGQSVYFANGQFLMIRGELYKRLGGHTAVKDCFLEDFALMKKAKESGANALCAQGQDLYGTHMYGSLRELWRGWRRIYLHGSSKSTLTLAAHTIELILASIAPALAVLAFYLGGKPGDFPIVVHGLSTLWFTLMLATATGIYKTLRAPAHFAILHPVAAIVTVGILIDAIRVSLLKQQTKWRG